jgi:hypothetical protein
VVGNLFLNINSIVLQLHFKISKPSSGTSARRKNNHPKCVAETNANATDCLNQYQAERQENNNLLARITTQAEKNAHLEAELEKQAPRQQQLQEENCVPRAKNVSLN